MRSTPSGADPGGSGQSVARCPVCGKSHPAGAACPASAPRNAKTPPLAAPAATDDLLGTRLGNFQIVRLLGRGGMGMVYLGEHALIGSRVAVKFLHPHLASDATLVKRFFAEARAANLIGHENIVSIFDLSLIPPNRYYLVMEYLDGQPLSALAGRPMPLEEAVPILSQACDALQAAHSAGVVHCDLKPENIFLVRRGSNSRFVKLVDFGIAKLSASTSGTTMGALAVGTPEFMAPEQWLGREVDGRADLYALGVIAYLLATGRLPFQEPTPLAFYAAHQIKQPIPPRQLNPSLSKVFEAAIGKALAKRPESRFLSAAEMREAFQRTIAPARISAVADRPQQPARNAGLSARVVCPGFPDRTLPAADLSRAGLYLLAEPPLPPLLARVRIALLHPQRSLEAEAEVVRHVDSAQAAAWNMPGRGFGVQFVNASQAFREAVARIVEGRPLEPHASPPDDASASALLEPWLRRSVGDPYAVLGVKTDAKCSEIGHQSRQALAQLDRLAAWPLSDRQREQLASVRRNVESAAEQLSAAARRAEHDAARGNFRGVARCLAAGLGAKELDALRASFLAMRSRNEASASLHAAAARAHAHAGEDQAALEKLEAALGLDPLNLQLHQSYWSLMRRTARAKGKA